MSEEDKYFLKIIVLCMCIFEISECFEIRNIDLGNVTYVRSIRAAKGQECQLPEYPRNGLWTIYESTKHYYPNQTAPSGTILQVSCRQNFKLESDSTIVCLNGKWSAEIGKCLKTCPSRFSSSIMTITCKINDRELESCTEPIHGTRAHFKCADYYEDHGLELHPVHVCSNGKWSHKPPECVPVCGQKSLKKDPTLIVGGNATKKGEYPWQVALYNHTNKELLCGGSLINQKVIVTAAHCITDETGRMYSKEVYSVAVGKYYREYDEVKDVNYAQFSTISEMFVPRQYRGEVQNFFGDIAVIVTVETFELSARVQPVCVDWGLNRQGLLDPARISHGYVSGWGFTVEHKDPSKVLKELKVPLITDQECLKRLPENYEKFLTDDKLCAGFFEEGTSVCKGDSGGGLVTQIQQGTSASRFYLVGVVSLSPQAPTTNGGCDSQNYALYTRVPYYVQTFILEKEVIYRPATVEDCQGDPECNAVTVIPSTTSTTTTEAPKPEIISDCILPEHPKGGSWSIFGAYVQFPPGTAVSTGTVLKVSCQKGHQFNGSELILCENGQWGPEIGRCLRICEPLTSTVSTEIICTYQEQELVNCTNPVEGTIAKYKCNPFYEEVQQTKNPVRLCRDGSWDAERSECVPVCGKKRVVPQLLIVNGTNAQKNEYPWFIGLYRDSRKEYICGAALISTRLVLTAAHCVSDIDGKAKSPSDFIVAAGKHYSGFFDPNDYNAQIRKVENISIPLFFSGLQRNFLADIAILITDKPFILSPTVQPVCIDYGKQHIDEDKIKDLKGYITSFGYTAPSSKLATTLQGLEMPIVSYEECINKLPEQYTQYITYDTVCAGYYNKSTSLCNGDSGAPLVVKSKDNDRYYITGITSVSPATSNGTCDTENYALFTKVWNYNDFILEKEASIRSSSGECHKNKDGSCSTFPFQTPPPKKASKTGCSLPNYPQFGKWTVYGDRSNRYRPGVVVDSGTLLQVTCYDKYKLLGDSITLCESGKWSTTIGQCLKSCPSILNTETTKATCFYKEVPKENCANPISGTVAKYECMPFHEDPQLNAHPVHLCNNGQWSHKIPNCLPVCGQKLDAPTTLLPNEKEEQRFDYPWQVAIYNSKDKTFLCSGTLINTSLKQKIITASQCVLNADGNVKPKQDFAVAAGKYYSAYEDSRENSKDVQFAKLSNIQYSGGAKIVSLELEKPFTLSLKVQPICFDYSSDLQNSLTVHNTTGYVSGWGHAGKSSERFQTMQVSVVDNSKCQETQSNDQFCAGIENKDQTQCSEDLGSAFIVKSNKRFYLAGILAAVPKQSGSCKNFASYTKFNSISFT